MTITATSIIFSAIFFSIGWATAELFKKEKHWGDVASSLFSVWCFILIYLLVFADWVK